jgi:hypothetical protein
MRQITRWANYDKEFQAEILARSFAWFIVER